MRIYSVTITGTSTSVLKESVTEMPMRFLVKCPNNESRVQCFDKISRKFKRNYGVVIESADVRLVKEGWWDRMKAKWNGHQAAKSAPKDAPKEQKQTLKEEGRRKSIFKSIRNNIENMFDEIETDLEKLGIKFDDSQNMSGGDKVVTLLKRYRNAKSMVNTFVKDLRNFYMSEEEIGADDEAMQQEKEARKKADVAAKKEAKKKEEEAARQEKVKKVNRTRSIDDIKPGKKIKKAARPDTSEINEIIKKAAAYIQKTHGKAETKEEIKKAVDAVVAKAEDKIGDELTPQEKAKAQQMVIKALQAAYHSSEGEETEITRVSAEDAAPKKDPFAPAPFF